MQEEKSTNINNSVPQFNVVSFKKGFIAPNIPIVTLLQGEKSYQFLLDTGSDESIINKAALADMEYTKKEEGNKHRLTGFGGSSEDLSLCEMTLQYKDLNITETFLVADLTESFIAIEQEHGIHLTGMLGSKCLRKNRFILDFNQLIAYNEKK